MTIYNLIKEFEELSKEFEETRKDTHNHTDILDMSFKELSDMYNTGDLIVNDMVVWEKDKRKSDYIYTILLHAKLEPIVFEEISMGKYKLMDGHKRINAYLSFIKNEFNLNSHYLLPSLKTFYYGQLPNEIKRHLNYKSIRINIIRESMSEKCKEYFTNYYYWAMYR